MYDEFHLQSHLNKGGGFPCAVTQIFYKINFVPPGNIELNDATRQFKA